MRMILSTSIIILNTNIHVALPIYYNFQKEKIKLIVKAASNLPSSAISNLRMVASGTFTSSGYIGNSTGHFIKQPSLNSIEEGKEQEVSFEFTPSVDLPPGSYTLMIGAESNSISYLKAIIIE